MLLSRCFAMRRGEHRHVRADLFPLGPRKASPQPLRLLVLLSVSRERNVGVLLDRETNGRAKFAGAQQINCVEFDERHSTVLTDDNGVNL